MGTDLVLLLSATVALCTCFLTNSNPVDELNVKEIEKVLQESFRCHDNPAMAVSLVKDRQVVFSRGFGVANIASGDSVDENTLFQIASDSKAFAATLLVKLLYEKTNLTVDSKVSELLGGQFKMPDKFRTEEVTFADLMAHKLAIPPNNILRFNDNLTRANLMEYHALLQTPYQFRVKAIYSNLNYGLIAHLAEVISGGKSWEDLVKESLYDPLGMTKSTFVSKVDFTRKDVATSYEKDFDGNIFEVSTKFLRLWSTLGGPNAVMTSANDMTKWMIFHLNGGKNYQGQSVMKTDQLNEVHKPRFYTSSSSSKDTKRPQFPVTSVEGNYAFGFKRGFYRGYERLSHSGTTPGSSAFVSLLPGQNIGIFTAMTGPDTSYTFKVPLHMYLMDMALGLNPWLNASTICSYPEPWKNSPKPFSPPKLIPGIPLKRAVSEYEGTYQHPAYGYLHISHNRTLSTLVMNYGWGTWQLFAQYSNTSDADTFYAKGLGANNVYDLFKPIIFLPDPNDSTKIVKLSANGFENSAPPSFVKIV